MSAVFLALWLASFVASARAARVPRVVAPAPVVPPHLFAVTVTSDEGEIETLWATWETMDSYRRAGWQVSAPFAGRETGVTS